MSQLIRLTVGYGKGGTRAITFRKRKKHRLAELNGPRLTHGSSEAKRPFVLWHLDDEEVEGQAREGNGDADEGVSGITVKWNSHQEDGAEAEDNGEEKAELGATEKMG